MEKIDRLKQLLLTHRTEDITKLTFEERLEFDDVFAQEIVKLFAIPDVMCSHEKTTKYMMTGIRYCSNPKCQKLIDIE